MGCHTWFINKISDMPQEHLEKLRKKCIRDIKKAFIYNCSCQDWINNTNRILENLEKRYSEEDKKTNEIYKNEKEMLEKHNTKEYYDKIHGKYVKDLEILQNPNSTKEEIFKVFKRHDLSFDLDKSGKDGTYPLDDLGWCDNYRVSGNPYYPTVTHHNAEEAIKWLEEYDNGHNICCDMEEGMCQEIRDILNDFFKQFPNGMIYYG